MNSIDSTPPDTREQSTDVADMAEIAILTRIYAGTYGRIILTVDAANYAQASMLVRACGAGIEAVMFRAFRDRLRQIC